MRAPPAVPLGVALLLPLLLPAPRARGSLCANWTGEAVTATCLVRGAPGPGPPSNDSAEDADAEGRCLPGPAESLEGGPARPPVLLLSCDAPCGRPPACSCRLRAWTPRPDNCSEAPPVTCWPGPAWTPALDALRAACLPGELGAAALGGLAAGALLAVGALLAAAALLGRRLRGRLRARGPRAKGWKLPREGPGPGPGPGSGRQPRYSSRAPRGPPSPPTPDYENVFQDFPPPPRARPRLPSSAEDDFYMNFEGPEGQPVYCNLQTSGWDTKPAAAAAAADEYVVPGR
ncbi:leucine-rich repeat-containing protein 25 [Erinaceus europaeus]|uniref:Leucine-rich repeat-containing protein 25 n=1 Tax=Erinaceus europaeus TaxID=9365 RepID=A0ABM3WP90_ERIEU|nr:leucine-rich repeat-containing protein 25 [Erinaceus europaeus]XP_060038383.1 leucine-rich repeat-containing protein 25 [Erinaceus europaeus]